MRRLLLFVVLLGLAAAASAQPQALVDQFQRRSITAHGVTVGYRLFVPANYDPAVRYPLVLALHGAGERGTDNEAHVRVHRLATAWADPVSQAANPAFVLAPQVPPNLRWSSDADPDNTAFEPVELATLDALAAVEAEFNIDADRVYVVGLSLGGHGTWDFISRLPGRFAAAVPMSGRGFVSQADDIQRVPIWAFHGESDTVVPASETRRVVQAMEDLGREVIYTDCRRSPVAAKNFDCPTPISQDSVDAAIEARADLLLTSVKNFGHGPWAPWFDRADLHRWMFSYVRQDPDAVSIAAPPAVWTGPTPITWTSARSAAETVEVWLGDGRDWTLAGTAPLGAGTFTVDPGSRNVAIARVRLVVLNADGRVVGRDVSAPFRIDGPGNGAPFVRLDDEALRFSPFVTAPTLTLPLTVADAENSTLSIDVRYSTNGGASYTLATGSSVASSPDVQTISVDLAGLPNTARARLRIGVSDGSSLTTVETSVFSKTTTRASPLPVDRVAGQGRGTVRALVADPAATTGHRYRIEIIASSGNGKTYSITDLDSPGTMLDRIPLSDGTLESPVFDGLTVVVKDAEAGEADPARTGWTTGVSTLGVDVNGGTARISILNVPLLATETTYTLTVTEGVAGRSIELYRIAARDVRFEVRGADGARRDVVFNDVNGDGRPGAGDALYLVEPDAQGQPALAWALTFTAPAGTVLPVAGDVFTLTPSPKLGPGDVFEFSAPRPVGTDALPDGGVEIVSSFPNPFSDRLTVAYRLAEPAAVRLEVVDALGRRVANLADGPQAAGDHTAVWPADVASGVFFVRLTATPAGGGPARRVQQSVVRVAR